MPRHKAGEPEDQSFTLEFGGGLNTRKTISDIDEAEACVLENADLDVDRMSLRRRPPLVPLFEVPNADREGTAPITAIIGPIWRVEDADGNVSTDPLEAGWLVQSLDKVYSVSFSKSIGWVVNATAIKTVTSTARLSYNPESFSFIDGYGVVTDRRLVTPVQKVQFPFSGGMTLVDMTHNLVSTDLYARHAFIERERLWLGGVRTDDGVTDTTTPHMIVASAVEDIETVSISDRPSSALGEGDPFYFLTPDLKPVNGLMTAYGSVIVSSQGGALAILEGVNSKDYNLRTLFSGSAAQGENAMAFVGNDLAYFTQGKLESLAGAEAFGDVEVDDFSRQIKKDMAEIPAYAASANEEFDATVMYHKAKNQIYVHKRGENCLWVFHKSFHDQKAKDVSLLKGGPAFSPWVKWCEDKASEPQGLLATDTVSNPWEEQFWHTPIRMARGPVGMATDYDFGGASDNYKLIDTVLMGGPDGVVYAIDTAYDTNSNTDYAIETFVPDGVGFQEPDLTNHVERCRVKWRSKLFISPSRAGFDNMTGRVWYIPRYDNGTPVSITLKVLLSGTRRKTKTKTVELPEHPGASPADFDSEDRLPRSVSFDVPCRDALSAQCEITWDDDLIEITGVDFDTNA